MAKTNDYDAQIAARKEQIRKLKGEIQDLKTKKAEAATEKPKKAEAAAREK